MLGINEISLPPYPKFRDCCGRKVGKNVRARSGGKALKHTAAVRRSTRWDPSVWVGEGLTGPHPLLRLLLLMGWGRAYF